MQQTPDPIGYRFGLFEMDLRTEELRRNGLKLKLQEQPFRLLVILLENAPGLVTRDGLARQLWDKDTFVNFDHSLNIAMSKIRVALGDAAESARFVETLPKRGYRFIAPVERLTNPDPTHAISGKRTVTWRRWNLWITLGAVVVAITLGSITLHRMISAPEVNAIYTKLTNFTDSAFAPAISPDGRMLAFVRGDLRGGQFGYVPS